VSALQWLAIILASVGGGVLTLVFSALSRAGRDAVSRLGKPTPEEARVKIETAETAASTQTKAATDAIQHADPDALLRRAHELRDRGRSGK
jgi:phosphate uptake regulator